MVETKLQLSLSYEECDALDMAIGSAEKDVKELLDLLREVDEHSERTEYWEARLAAIRSLGKKIEKARADGRVARILEELNIEAEGRTAAQANG